MRDRMGANAYAPRWRATPRALLRGLGLSALIAFAAGCSDQELREIKQTSAERDVRSLARVCIDGVQYLANSVRGGTVLTPHLQANGKPHTCGNASGIEAQRAATTKIGVVHESPTEQSEGTPNG